MQELFRTQTGVTKTEVGYTGGKNVHPTYDHHPGHAEALAITYSDDTTLDALLDYFFTIHDPTTVNRQGNDTGSSYRSAIFYANDTEEQAAKKAIERNQNYWDAPIVTRLEPLDTFWSAEDEHQDYLQKNPGGYTCHYERERTPLQRILFVYNANGGVANALLDYGKKYISPSTYDCQLCMVTYGPFGMKKEWKQFVDGLPHTVVFLHKDELLKQYPDANITLPAVLKEGDGALEVMISSEDFERVATLDDLRVMVESKIPRE